MIRGRAASRTSSFTSTGSRRCSPWRTKSADAAQDLAGAQRCRRDLVTAGSRRGERRVARLDPSRAAARVRDDGGERLVQLWARPAAMPPERT